MDYQLTLEKAVLDYANSAATRVKTRPDEYVQIPGYPDVHVWSMSVQLHNRGLLTAAIPSDEREIKIMHISEPGSARRKDLRTRELQLAETRKREMDEAIERGRQARLQKKWWRRILGRGKVSA